MKNEPAAIQARDRLRQAERIAVLTGAGVSAESGVPTFRGAGGLWKNYRATDIATPESFRRNPELVWEFYNWRRGMLAEKKPNAAHEALARMEAARDLTLITQNIDGLHLAAGSRNILELHGSVWRLRCTGCGSKRPDRTAPLAYPPLCQSCNGLLRPDVVWFGESLDMGLLTRAFDAAAACEVMIVAGTSAVVQPAASAAWRAKQAGAYVIEVNLEPTSFSPEADVSLLGPASEVLSFLAEGWA